MALNKRTNRVPLSLNPKIQLSKGSHRVKSLLSHVFLLYSFYLLFIFLWVEWGWGEKRNKSKLKGIKLMDYRKQKIIFDKPRTEKVLILMDKAKLKGIKIAVVSQ